MWRSRGLRSSLQDGQTLLPGDQLNKKHSKVHAQTENNVMSTEDLLQAQLELYHHSMAYVKSAALRAATDLRIPDVIYRRGGVATLSDIATETGIHPTKYSHLRRLMQALTVFGIFSVEGCDGDARYKLTLVSRLLVEDGENLCTQSPIVRVLVDPLSVTALCSIGEWFTDERASAMTLFEVAHGCTRSEMTAKNGTGGLFQTGMIADSRLVMEVVLKEHNSVFQGVSSLVDAGGGHGAAAASIAKVLPHVKCTVLDLPHVVAGAPTSDNVQFVAGDVFEYIPPADAVLLKWVMCLWQDEDAVKVLRRCKEAIPAGGKVIIFDAVLESGMSQNILLRETQVLFDVQMMRVDGGEREEEQWRNIFTEAGFRDYKITPMLGFRSIIEVYP
ncbi:hypothetical protein QYE76_029857 [Lolium multiflorum]|uniref:Uncharacterized protein n=1 Tax=Lolium multiflorum TaxID=4521 RepID=A0AAD8VH31_LOLMU|nr:hypothetical protein QYE76_029857 [Lolium multiflorum]